MQAVADRRLQDEQRSSNNSKTRAVAAAATEAAAAACSTVEQLVQKLERARQLRGSGALQEVERCEAELEAAHAELEASRGREARANSLVMSLRRNQSAKQACSPLPPLAPHHCFLHEDALTTHSRARQVVANPGARLCLPSSLLLSPAHPAHPHLHTSLRVCEL